jgi:hypothetical protein
VSSSAALPRCLPALPHRGAIEQFLVANEEVKHQLEQLALVRERLQRQVNFGAVAPSSGDGNHPLQRYIDPIARSIMRDPVTAEDGNNYERRHIELCMSELAGEEFRSPITREPMGLSLTPNAALKEEIRQVNQRVSLRRHACAGVLLSRVLYAVRVGSAYLCWPLACCDVL